MTILDDGLVLKKVNIYWMQNKEVISYLLGGKDIRIPRLYDSLKDIELNTISMLESIGDNQIRESVRLKVLYGR